VKEEQKPQLHTSEFSTNAVNSRTVLKNATKETPSKIAKKLLIEKEETAKSISEPKVSPGLTIKYERAEHQSVKEERNHGEREKSSLPAVKRCETVSDDDAFERKRQRVIEYQRFLQREGPKNPGGKVVPQVLDYVRTVTCSVQ